MVISIILSLCMLSMTLVAQHQLRVPFFSEKIESLLFYLLNIKLIFFYTLPCFFRLLGYSFYQDINITISDVTYVYIVEFIFHFVWLVTFIFFRFLLLKPAAQSSFHDRYFYLLILPFLVIFLSGRLGLFPLPNIILILFQPLSVEFMKAASLILLFYPHKNNPWFWRVIGVLSLIIVFLSFSSRGSIFYLILLSFYFLFVWRREKLLVYGVALVPTLIFLFFTTTAFIPKIQLNENGHLRVDLSDLSQKRLSRSPGEEIAWRLGALTRFSTGFIKMYDRGFDGGWSPIVNSTLGVLPRSFNPEKPHPSTLDGDDIYSQGMYLTVRELTGITTNMAEFSVGAQSYWEIGTSGLFVYASFSSFIVTLFLWFYRKLGTLCAFTLLIVLSKPFGYVEVKVWPSELIFHFYSKFLPLAFVVFVVYVFQQIKMRRF